jgi:hypothetical protein
MTEKPEEIRAVVERRFSEVARAPARPAGR